MTDVTMTSTDAVLAAIPSLLGFAPANSLVVLPFADLGNGRSRLEGPLMRFDLPDALARQDAIASAIEQSLRATWPLQLMLVVTTDHVSDTGELPYYQFVMALATDLCRRGAVDPELIFVAGFTAGNTWRCYTHSDHAGLLPEPATSDIGLAYAALGRPALASREDLARRFTPAPEDDRARVAAWMEAAVRQVQDDMARDDTSAVLTRLDWLDNAVTAARHGKLPHDGADIAAFIASLATPTLRDAMLAPATEEDRLAAENLALHLWRHAAEPFASELIDYIAALAWQRGDSATVSIAAGVAAQRVTLTKIVCTAAAHAIPPARAVELFAEAACGLRRELRTQSRSGESAPHSTS